MGVLPRPNEIAPLLLRPNLHQLLQTPNLPRRVHQTPRIRPRHLRHVHIPVRIQRNPVRRDELPRLQPRPRIPQPRQRPTLQIVHAHPAGPNPGAPSFVPIAAPNSPMYNNCRPSASKEPSSMYKPQGFAMFTHCVSYFPLESKNLHPMILPIRHVNVPVLVRRDVVDDVELPRLRPRPAPRKQQIPALVILVDAWRCSTRPTRRCRCSRDR